jgi:hypothetical protein
MVELTQKNSIIDFFGRNDKSTLAFELTVAFVSGVIFSPWSWGFIYFLLFLIVYELFLVWASKCQSPYWNLHSRILVVVFSLFGFIIGRLLAGHSDPLKSKRK